MKPAGWLNQLTLTRAADMAAKLIAFLAPGVIAFCGGLMLPNCVPMRWSDSLTFPAVSAFVTGHEPVHDPVDPIFSPPRSVDGKSQAPLPGWTTQAKCLRVIDGDTVEVEVRRVFRVRLLDCWAPESKIDPRVNEADQVREKQAGQAAKENLRKLAEGKDCVVQIPGDVDVAKAITMGRWLGRVWVGEVELSEAQVSGGFAETTKPERLK